MIEDGTTELADYQMTVVRAWRQKNFPNHTLLGQIAGATGELAGESLQSALKLEDGRVDGLDHEHKIKDGIGDTLIYLMGACDKLGTTLEECFHIAWGEVGRREHAKWGEAKAAHAQAYRDDSKGDTPDPEGIARGGNW